MTTTDHLSSYNKDHSVNKFNHVIFVATVTVCVLALPASFLLPTITVPYIGMITSTRRSVFVELIILALVFNTDSLYTYYISKFRIPMMLRLLGASVYISQLVAMLIGLFRPAVWLRAVAFILLLRLGVSLYLWLCSRGKVGDGVNRITRLWVKNSFMAMAVMFAAAVAAEFLFDPAFWVAFHGIARNPITEPLVSQFAADIQTIVDALLCIIVWPYTFWSVTFSEKFAPSAIEEFDQELNTVYANGKV